MLKEIELRIKSVVPNSELNSSHIKRMGLTNKTFNHKIKKRSVATDSTVVIAIISSTSAILGLFISNLLEYYKTKHGKKIIIKVKNKEKEINIEFNSSMKPEDILNYTQKMKLMNEYDINIVEENG